MKRSREFEWDEKRKWLQSHKLEHLNWILSKCGYGYQPSKNKDLALRRIDKFIAESPKDVFALLIDRYSREVYEPYVEMTRQKTIEMKEKKKLKFETFYHEYIAGYIKKSRHLVLCLPVAGGRHISLLAKVYSNIPDDPSKFTPKRDLVANLTGVAYSDDVKFVKAERANAAHIMSLRRGSHIVRVRSDLSLVSRAAKSYKQEIRASYWALADERLPPWQFFGLDAKNPLDLMPFVSWSATKVFAQNLELQNQRETIIRSLELFPTVLVEAILLPYLILCPTYDGVVRCFLL